MNYQRPKPLCYALITLIACILTSGCSNEESDTLTTAQTAAQRQVVEHALQQYAQTAERDRRISHIANALEQVTDNVQTLSSKTLPENTSEPHFQDVADSLVTVLCVIKHTALPSVSSPANTLCNETSNTTLQRLTQFMQDYPAFSQREMRVYYHSDDEQLLAYALRGKKERIYIIANLSYDILPIPFPHGFMTSTKVTLWETNQPSTRTFVTQWPLSIQPMSAVIIKV